MALAFKKKNGFRIAKKKSLTGVFFLGLGPWQLGVAQKQNASLSGEEAKLLSRLLPFPAVLSSHSPSRRFAGLGHVPWPGEVCFVPDMLLPQCECLLKTENDGWQTVSYLWGST